MTSRTQESKTMSKARKVLLVFAIWTLFGLTVRFVLSALAAEAALPAFERTWARTDQPVANHLVSRTWMWGEQVTTEALTEPYADAPGGSRLVQYFDKSRMEDNRYRAATAPWDVTNGLLVVELVTGRLQLGDDTFEQHAPAAVNVAGDPDDPTGPQYQTLSALLDAPPLPDGAIITQRLERDGTVTEDLALAAYGVVAAEHVQVPGIDHQVAAPFWAFMTSEGMVYEEGDYLEAPLFLNPFYATGYPITEAYWAEVKVAGTYQEVLMQCFERRCLTYTPGNAAGWQVEAGNVGLHYYTWRYEQLAGEEDGDPGPTPTAVGEEPGATPSATEPPDEPTATAPVASPTATEIPDPPEEDPTPTEPEHDTAIEYRYAGGWGETVDPDDNLHGVTGVAIGPNGHLYALVSNDLFKYTTGGIFDSSWSADSSGLNRATQLTVDGAGNIWVADPGSDRVFKYSPNGSLLGELSDFGSGGSAFEGPHDVALDSAGYIYVTDDADNVVRKFDPAGILVDQWGDDPGEPEFSRPAGITVDSNDVIYVVDCLNRRLLKFDTSGTVVDEWNATTGFNPDFPLDVAVSSSGTIYITDEQVPGVLVYNASGAFIDRWGQGGTDAGEFWDPLGIALDSTGNVYVADSDNDRIQVFDAQGNYLDQWEGAHRGRLAIPTSGIAADDDDNVYLLDPTYNRIQKFERDGDFIAEFRPEDVGERRFRENDDLVIGRDGYLYAVDSANQKLLKLTRDGEPVDEYSISQVDTATGITTDEQGDFYISDLDYTSTRLTGISGVNGGSVHKYSSSGAFLGTWKDSRMGSALDVATYGDRVYVADAVNNLVHVFDTDGTYLEAWSEPADSGGQFSRPLAVAIDSGGYLFVVDSGNDRVVKLTSEGEYITEFGASTHGSGPFDTLAEIAISEDGTVFLLDLKLGGGGSIEAVQVHRLEPR